MIGRHCSPIRVETLPEAMYSNHEKSQVTSWLDDHLYRGPDVATKWMITAGHTF